MTEKEWRADPPTLGPMLRFIAGFGSERKLRLFLYASCRRIEHLLIDDRSKIVFNELGRFFEGQSNYDLSSLQSLARAACDAIEAPLRVGRVLRATAECDAAGAIDSATWCDFSMARSKDDVLSSLTSAAFLARSAVARPVYLQTTDPAAATAAELVETRVQAEFLRDIFGPLPFRPLTFNTAWRTSDVLSLARGIHEERAFDRMPILADALQDADCDNADILTHCRDTSLTHVRGCWVVDLILEKV